MKITWIVLDDITPGVRNESTATRARTVVPHMPGAVICSTVDFVKKCDVIVYQDRFAPHDVPLAKELVASGKMAMMDLSVPIWSATHPLSQLGSRECFEKMARLSSCVVVPSLEYKHSLESTIDNIRVEVIPSRGLNDAGTSAKEYVDLIYSILGIPQKESHPVLYKEIDEPVSIIIPVYNCLQYLGQCVESTLKYTNNYELIIIDNGSDSQTKDYIKSLSNVRVITNRENKGFAYACNQGVKIAKYKYYCLLNSDTLVTPNWLSNLMKGFNQPNAGIVGPVTLYCSTVQSLLSAPRYTMPYKEMDKIAKLKDEVKVGDLIELSRQLKEGYVVAEHLVGFCYLIRKKVIDRIGVFDWKAFPLAGGEEIDFNRRTRAAGFKLYIVKNAYVHHFKHKTLLELGMDIKALARRSEIAKQERRLSRLFVANDVKMDKEGFSKVIVTANIGMVNTMITAHRNNPKFNYILFTDAPTVKSDFWNVRHVRSKFHDPRRDARMYKWLIHRFVDAEYSLWVDSNITIEADIEELIEKYLKNADVAIHRHGLRDCLYQEADICFEHKLDYRELIESQMKRYRSDGYPENNGLFETRVVLRRHTEQISEFNEAVWIELCRGSARDQICVNYVAWKLGIKVNTLAGTFTKDNKEVRFEVAMHTVRNRMYPATRRSYV